MEQEILIEKIKPWIYEAADFIRMNLDEEREISQKKDRTDLVTDIDQKVQDLLIEKINLSFPNDQILAEENGYDVLQNMMGRVWIIDPIDGTMNFIMEKENFCIMLAVFENGQGNLGLIYDVMSDELYWGGKGIGVFCNQSPLKHVENNALNDGLIGMNAYMYANNIYQAQSIGQTSMGIRVSGCAGIEFIALLKGNHLAYLSNLNPWDYAAGIVLLEELGGQYSTITGKNLSFNQREYFLAATPKAYRQILAMVQ